jgi:hypothetical protein
MPPENPPPLAPGYPAPLPPSNPAPVAPSGPPSIAAPEDFESSFTLVVNFTTESESSALAVLELFTALRSEDGNTTVASRVTQALQQAGINLTMESVMTIQEELSSSPPQPSSPPPAAPPPAPVARLSFKPSWPLWLVLIGLLPVWCCCYLCARRRTQRIVQFVVRLELAWHEEDGCGDALAPFWLPLMFAATEQPGEPTPLAHAASKSVKATLRSALHATIATATQCRAECWDIQVQALHGTAESMDDGLGPLAELLVLHAVVCVRFGKRLSWDTEDFRRVADTYRAEVTCRQTRARPSPLSEQLAAELQATGWSGLDVYAAFVGPVELPPLPNKTVTLRPALLQRGAPPPPAFDSVFDMPAEITGGAAAGDAARQTRGASLLSCLQQAVPLAPDSQPTARNLQRRASRASQPRLPHTPLFASPDDRHAFSSAENALAATIASAVQALVGGAAPYADMERGSLLSSDDSLSDARALRILRAARRGVDDEEQPDEAPALHLPPWATAAGRPPGARQPEVSASAAANVEMATITPVDNPLFPN